MNIFAISKRERECGHGEEKGSLVKLLNTISVLSNCCAISRPRSILWWFSSGKMWSEKNSDFFFPPPFYIFIPTEHESWSVSFIYFGEVTISLSPQAAIMRKSRNRYLNISEPPGTRSTTAVLPTFPPRRLTLGLIEREKCRRVLESQLWGGGKLLVK